MTVRLIKVPVKREMILVMEFRTNKGLFLMLQQF